MGNQSMELLVRIYCYGHAEIGCGLESEKAWEMRGVSEGGTNGTWLQLVRSCAIPIDCGVPDFMGRVGQMHGVHRGFRCRVAL